MASNASSQEISYTVHNKTQKTFTHGRIQRTTKPTYGDLMKFISKKHNYHGSCLRYDIPLNPDDAIPNNAAHRQLTYDLSQKEFDKMMLNIHSHDKAPFVLPDFYDCYELAIIKLTIYVHNPAVNTDVHPLSKWHNIEKKMITCIVKIIKETEHYYIIKLPAYYHINWGCGPTTASLYALLQKEPRYCYPIYLDYSAFENIIIKYVKEYDNTDISYCKFPWETFTPDICSVCLESPSKAYCYCDDYHLAACEKCIEKLPTCPFCYKKIVGYDLVKHDL